MYKLPYYTEPDSDTLFAFMERHPFAIITGQGENGPVATHVPLAVERTATGSLLLSGHIMHKTDHYLAFEKEPEVLVIFTGPHCYVSASWYTNPAVGSTWNYMTVHAYGKISFTGEAGTRAVLKAVTERFEGTESAASFDRLPDEYISQMLKAITGFTIEVERLENVFKLSQNRDIASQQTIITRLKARADENSVAIAREMEERMR
ncbi:MAG: FMN-binding negative transcriptional regulator [Ferruginibacter sp.]